MFKTCNFNKCCQCKFWCLDQILRDFMLIMDVHLCSKTPIQIAFRFNICLSVSTSNDKPTQRKCKNI